jgi:hypothetical protein
MKIFFSNYVCFSKCPNFNLPLEAINVTTYSYLSNSQGGWNKHGGGAKVLELMNKEVGINMKGGIF